MIKMTQLQKIREAYESIAERYDSIKKGFLKNSVTKKEILFSLFKSTNIKDIIHNISAQLCFNIVFTFIFNVFQYFLKGNNSFKISILVFLLSCIISFTIFSKILYLKQREKIIKKRFVTQEDINYLLIFFDEIDKRHQGFSEKSIIKFKNSLASHIKEQKGYVTFSFYEQTMNECKAIFERIEKKEIENNAIEIADTIISDFYKDQKNLKKIELKEKELEKL